MRKHLLFAAAIGLAAAAAGAHGEAASWRLEDRSRIHDTLVRYCTAVDRMDWDLYKSVFAKNAVVDYTAAGGPKGSASEIADWLKMVFETLPIRLSRHQHLITNVEIAFDESGDSATVRAAFTAPMSINVMPLEYGPLFSAAGWYHHRMVRVGSEWKSAGLREEIAYNQAIVHCVAIAVALAYAAALAVRQCCGRRAGAAVKAKGE